MSFQTLLYHVSLYVFLFYPFLRILKKYKTFDISLLEKLYRRQQMKKYVTLDFKLVTIIILLHHILMYCIFCVWKFKYLKNIQLRNVWIKVSVVPKQLWYLFRYVNNRNCVAITFIQQLAKNYKSQYLSPVASFSFGRRMW